MEKKEKENRENPERRHQQDTNDFNDNQPTTFKIHPDDMQFLSEDFDEGWEDASSQPVETEESVAVDEDPREAFEEKVLKGLEILEQIKGCILKDNDRVE